MGNLQNVAVYVLQTLMTRRKGLLAVGIFCLMLLIYGQAIAQETLPPFRADEVVVEKNAVEEQSSVMSSKITTPHVSSSTPAIEKSNTQSVIDEESNDATAEVDKLNSIEVNIDINKTATRESKSGVIVNNHNIPITDMRMTQRVELDDGTRIKLRIDNDSDNSITDIDTQNSVQISVDSKSSQEGGSD